MANEQIILTQGDYGIEIQVQFLDSKKKPVNGTGCQAEVTFVNILNPKYTKLGNAINETLGLYSFLITEEETKNIGLTTTFWRLVSNDSYVTAQETLNYFTLPKDMGIS